MRPAAGVDSTSTVVDDPLHEAVPAHAILEWVDGRRQLEKVANDNDLGTFKGQSLGPETVGGLHACAAGSHDQVKSHEVQILDLLTSSMMTTSVDKALCALYAQAGATCTFQSL